jgi:hypothetical protein
MEQLLGPAGARAGGKAVLQSVLAGLEAERQSRRAELDKPGASLPARVVRVRSTWDSRGAPRVTACTEAGAALGELLPPPGRETTRCEVSVAFEAEARVDRLACVVSAKLAEVIFDGAYVTTVRGQAADDESGLFSHSVCFASLAQAPPLCSVLTVRFLSLHGDKDNRVVRLGPLLVDAVSGSRAGEGSAGDFESLGGRGASRAVEKKADKRDNLALAQAQPVYLPTNTKRPRGSRGGKRERQKLEAAAQRAHEAYLNMGGGYAGAVARAAGGVPPPGALGVAQHLVKGAEHDEEEEEEGGGEEETSSVSVDMLLEDAREESANEVLGARALSESSENLGAKTPSEPSANLDAKTQSASLAVARQLHLVAGNVEALSQRVGALELALQRRADVTDAKIDLILALLHARS